MHGYNSVVPSAKFLTDLTTIVTDLEARDNASSKFQISLLEILYDNSPLYD